LGNRELYWLVLGLVVKGMRFWVSVRANEKGIDFMKVVILAGGLGTRMTEETEIKPKPMVEIGGRPILWHIMEHYSRHGHKEFFIALGYKSEVIKNFFINYKAFSRKL